MVVGRLLSYWGGPFSGAMLNFGGVSHTFASTLFDSSQKKWMAFNDPCLSKKRKPWKKKKKGSHGNGMSLICHQTKKKTDIDWRGTPCIKRWVFLEPNVPDFIQVIPRGMTEPFLGNKKNTTRSYKPCRNFGEQAGQGVEISKQNHQFSAHLGLDFLAEIR